MNTSSRTGVSRFTTGVRVTVVLATTAALIGLTVTAAHAGERPAGSGAAESAGSRRNVALVETALRVVFNEHRLDQIDRYFSAGFVQHSPLVPAPGRDGLRQWLAGTIESIPDLSYRTDQVLVDGDRVVVFATVRGTISRDLPAYGITAHGQHVDIATSQVFRVAHGRIAEHWEVVDTGPLVSLAYASQTR